MALAAVVVCHNHSNHLGEIFESFAQQKTALDYMVLVSHDGKLDENFGTPARVIQVASNHADDFDEGVIAGLNALPDEVLKNPDSWFWLLSNRAVPTAASLDRLVAARDASVSAAIVAPKIMDGENPRIIRELGVTLTQRNSVFRSVTDEFDQGQHDHIEDVLAASLEGSLVSYHRIKQAGGFATKFVSFAADIELAVRLRLNGNRVILAPDAKVNQFGSVRKPARYADMQLKLYYWPLWLALLFAVLLPALVTVKSILLLLRKQPESIAAELAAGIRAFFTAPAILLHRRTLTRKQRAALPSLRVLQANRDDLSTKKIETRHYANLNTTAIITVKASQVPPKFWSSGAGWIMVALAALSWSYWPTNLAASGPGLLTLPTQWIDLFARTGASWQPLASGFYAPSDPFNWVLLALGSVTYWAPSLSIAVLFLLAKSLAFTATWRALTLVTNKFWLLTLGGLTYAFWPAFTSAQSEARLTAVLSFVLLPWFVYALARTLGFGSEQLTRQSTWAWLSLTALLAAALAATAPSLAPLVTLAVFGLAIYRYRKIGYLIWLPVPLAVIWLPTVWYLMFSLGSPAALFTDPGLPLATQVQPAYKLLLGMVPPTGNSQQVFDGLFGLLAAAAVAVILAVALFAPWRTRSNSSLILWIGLAVSVLGAWAFQQVKFVANGVVGPSTGEQYVNGSPHALLAVAALLAIFLFAIALGDQSKLGDSAAGRTNGSKLLARIGGALGFIGASTLVALFIVNPSQLSYNDARVVPAIIQAEANQANPQAGKLVRMLVIRPQLSNDEALQYTATLVTGDGIQQSDLSVNYRYTLAKLGKNDAKFESIAAVAANLIAANDSNVMQELLANQIGYILVPTETTEELARSSSQLSNDLDSSGQLLRVGTTEFGNLWKVNGEPDAEQLAANQDDPSDDYWSLTKSIQFGVLMVFLLLALPNRRRSSALVYEDEVDEFDVEESHEVAK